MALLWRTSLCLREKWDFLLFLELRKPGPADCDGSVTQSESRMPAWLPRGRNVQSPMLIKHILERQAESGACPLCNFSCGVLVCGHWDPLDVTCSAAHWLDCLTWVETCIWGSRKGNQLGSYTFLTCLEMRGTRRYPVTAWIPLGILI